jgi:hypothetical protein
VGFLQFFDEHPQLLLAANCADDSIKRSGLNAEHDGRKEQRKDHLLIARPFELRGGLFQVPVRPDHKSRADWAWSEHACASNREWERTVLSVTSSFRTRSVDSTAYESAHAKIPR